MTPTGSETSGRNGALLVTRKGWQALSEAQGRGFASLCPVLVVELACPRDEEPRGLTAPRRKMAAEKRNGSQLGWLLIPQEWAVEVWGPLRADAETPPADGAGLAPLR